MKKNTAFNIALSSGRFDREKEYWLARLAGDLPAVHFPYDSKYPDKSGSRWGEVQFAVPGEVAARLTNLSNKSSKRLLMALIAGVQALLYRYTYEEDVLILTPVETVAKGQEYLNTGLILRNQLSRARSYKTLLLAVKDALVEAEKQQNFPYSVICEMLGTTARELLHVGVVLENLQEREHLAEAECELTFCFAEDGEAIWGTIYYDRNRYHLTTVQQLADDWNWLMGRVMANLDLTLEEMISLHVIERAEIFRSLQTTGQGILEQLTVHQLFEEQARLRPGQIAVEINGEKLTYGELEQNASKIAGVLHQLGVVPDQFIGIMARPSFVLFSGLLGIMKAGGAYLPLDPAYPPERIRYCLQDSATQILLCESQLLQTVPEEYAGKVLSLEEVLQSAEQSLPLPTVSPENLAYLIYTSGSTGEPKGSMIEHQSVVNLLRWSLREMEITCHDRGAFFSNISFDLAVLNIFAIFTAGATLVVIPAETRQDPVKLGRWLREERITIAGISTRMAELVMQEEPALPLRLLYAGGEKLHQVPQTHYPVLNAYGPTENTVVSTSYRVQPDDPYPEPPIGKAVDHVQVYVLDANLQPVPNLVVGEIYLGGRGVARGYWNRKELTGQAFLPDPWQPGQRMYRTGDLGRWLSDGNLEFVGRRDSQVKLRGFRIEMGEIEARLNSHPDVRGAVVLLTEEAGDAYLVAYIATACPLKIKEIRAFLQQTMPAYMIPSGYVFLDELPVTEHGKINHRALHQFTPQMADTGSYVPPTNPQEEELCKIWADVLHVETVGIEDHFFDLGGHSLKAATLISEVHRHFGVELSLQDIFLAPTVREMALQIASGRASARRVIATQPGREYYPVSSAQKRLYILWTFDRTETNYNIPGAMLIEGPLTQERFLQAIYALLRRHDSLRTYFELLDGEIVQKVKGKVDFQVEFGVSRTQGEPAIEELIHQFIRPFDLQQAPLFRVGLYELAPERYLFMTDMHHIISDGLSMSILQREFVELYNGVELEPLQIQYKDYAIWQQQLALSGALQAQEEFWLREFAGEIPVLDIPADYPRPAVLTYAGGSVERTLPQETRDALLGLARKEGATLFMVMLALYSVFLTRFGRQEEVVIGTPTDGRPTEDVRKLIGMFVNTLPLRLKPDGQRTFTEYLHEVREKFFVVMENQEYQFEMLIEHLQLARDPSRNPLFDTMLTLQNWDLPAAGMQIAGLDFRPLHFELSAVKMDLVLNIRDQADSLGLVFEYNSSLFTRETAERMLECLTTLITEVLHAPGQMLNRYLLTSAAERHQLLQEFNRPLAPYPDQQVTIAQYLEEHARNQPDTPAIFYGDEQVSYGELNRRANQVAHRLRASGVRPESIVAMLVERSVEMLVGLFAIFKAGGAYLPVDPRHPIGRIQYTLADSGAQFLLTQQKFANQVKDVWALNAETGSKGASHETPVQVLYLDEPALYVGDATDLLVQNAPADLAYIIYTSGSTGRPKGVMIEHKNMVNALVRHQKYYPVEPGWIYLLYTSYTFDASVYELFGWVIGGGSVLVLQPGEEKDPAQILQAIDQHNVTHAHFVPSMLSIFCNDLAEEKLSPLNKLHYLYVGGETISPETIKKFYRKTLGTTLYNVYGPTEVTIDATDFLVRRDELFKTVPIGKPLENVQIYILDANLQLQPIGVPGEICIGGLGVGRGYLRRPELTAEKFIQNPFSSDGMLYRSGDLGRWLADGNLEFLGRIDHQVKVRGFRIELGEIENCLRSQKAIKDAVVVSRQNTRGETYLCAYFSSDAELPVQELQNDLLRFLPEYMVPAYFVRLDTFPLLPSGKVDRHALPEPGGIVHTGAEYVAPRNELEETLSRIWKEILGLEQVSVHDSFFQVGGNSLSIIQLMEKVKGITDVPLTVANLFSYHTIAMCAEFLQGESGTPAESLEMPFDDLLAKLANDELSPEEAARLFSGER